MKAPCCQPLASALPGAAAIWRAIRYFITIQSSKVTSMHTGFTVSRGGRLHRRLLFARCAGLALTCLLGPSAALAAFPASPSPAACDAEGFATVLQAIPGDAQATDARAYWLNRQLIKWPGTTPAGAFKLYYSANRPLRATTNAVTRADAAIELQPF